MIGQIHTGAVIRSTNKGGGIPTRPRPRAGVREEIEGNRNTEGFSARRLSRAVIGRHLDVSLLSVLVHVADVPAHDARSLCFPLTPLLHAPGVLPW